MIHSVKDFVDKKMNNKLICFNNVSDDYLFFYDIKKDSFCATKRNKKHSKDDHVFLDDYKNIKEKIYFKDRNIIDNLYNKIIPDEIHSFHVSFRIAHENQMKWYECQENKIDQKEIVLGTIYEKNKVKIKENVGVENLFDSFKLNNAGFALMMKVDQYDEIHFTTYYKYGDFVKSSIKKCIISSLKKRQKYIELDSWNFLIIDLEGNAKDAKNLLQRITDNKQKIYFSIVAGAIELSKEFYSYDGVLECLNFSLNRAEGFNGNKFYLFDMQHYIRLKRKEDVLKHIYWAINYDFEGFELYYQPIIDINTKSIIALEALLRFKKKDEYIQPKEFISLLEQTHLILPVGRWVLKSAMESCKELQRLIPGLKMNVNLSFVQVNQNNSVQMILDILDEIEIDTTLLGIEITETGELNSNQYFNFCVGLEKGRIALILDDYGSGFSNIHRLAVAKPQYIKIDHSFTKQIIKSDYYRKILKNTISMAHDLGLLICIEGIEESDEYDVIKSLGADYMQGYLFARPMDKHSFIKDHKRMSENFLNN